MEPLEIFVWYDGPRTFTFRDNNGELCLAHWYDETKEETLFFVASVSGETVESLRRNELTLREVLSQGFIVYQNLEGEITKVEPALSDVIPNVTLGEKKKIA